MSYTNYTDMEPIIEQNEASVLSYSLLSPLDAAFVHGRPGISMGRYSQQAQEYNSSRCANNWDQACEILSLDTKNQFPNMVSGSNVDLITGSHVRGLTSGEQLVRNTAFKKYRVQVNNCNLLLAPYNPMTPNAQLYSQQSTIDAGMRNPRWSASYGSVPSGTCSSYYSLENIQNLDSDPVLNKLIQMPYIAQDLLIRIYYQMQKTGKLGMLRGSNIGKFYQTLGYSL